MAVVAAMLGALVLAVESPRLDEPRDADVIVVLGGLGSKAVLAEANRLADEGYADRVVISDAFGQDGTPDHLCTKFPEKFECFEPQPGTTQGEARQIEAFAEERGWNEILVVTRSYHVTRAKILISRCYAGEVGMIGVDGDQGLGDRLYQLLYQAGGFAKAAVTPGC